MGNARGWSWKICEGKNCKKKCRRMWKAYGKFLCYNCYQKSVKMMEGSNSGYTLKQALDKVYEVKMRVDKSGYLATKGIYLPKILIGKRFKIVLIK